MRVAYNKVVVNRDIEKKIRKMFFQKIDMKNICQNTGLTERVIRRIVNEHKWQQKRNRYYRLLCFLSYKLGISLNEMSRRSGVGYYTIAETRRQLGVAKAKRKAWNKKLTTDIENKFIEEYILGKSSNKIAKKYGFKRRETVLEILKKHKIMRREPKIATYYKEDFFEKIDCPEKAYILGLIMTDGYIIKDYCGFGIQLTKKDGYILRKIGKILGSTNRVLTLNCNTKRKTVPNAKDMCRLTITNRKIAADLRRLGVTRNKSKTLEYNGCVPRKYLSHFLRGIIDGDGTIGIAKNNNIWCQLTSSSRKFIDNLLSISLPFVLKLNISKTKYFNKNKLKKTCTMYVARVSGGNKETINFLKWLYNDKGDLYLRRKYAKVQNQIG